MHSQLNYLRLFNWSKNTGAEKTPRISECTDYLYIPDNEPGIDVVNVVEKHGGNCPGDPQTQPRLFSVSVDKRTHKMQSDINDPEDGTLSPLRKSECSPMEILMRK